jgi:uncharacterized repeat protein (TIGR04076 family)
MNEKKDLTEQTFEDDIVQQFIESENRYRQEATITKVEGSCPFGHNEGEKFQVTNCNNDGLCGALYKSIHSQLVTMHYGGSIPWAKDPNGFEGLCPEMGKVQVSVKRFEKDNFKLFKTRWQPRDMTGKGFRGLDEYKLIIEVTDVANRCAWGNRAGKRYEVDPFNTGGACGYMYARYYDFITLYSAGGSVPWEFEKDTLMSVCPDSYNQVSYRLIREKR